MTDDLIAEETGPKLYTGTGVLESAITLGKDLDKPWPILAVDGVSVGLDVLSLAMNPVGELVKYGVAWLMEHLEPLREALELVTGDAAQIQAVSQSWKKMAVELDGAAVDYAAALNAGISWKGAAAEAYARAATEVIEGITGVADHARNLAMGVAAAGVVVATCRAVVFDLIATFVSRIIAEAILAAAAAGPTFGASTAAFMTSFMVDLSIQCARVIRLLGQLLKKVSEFVRRLRFLGQNARTAANALMHRGNKLLGAASKRAYDANKTNRKLTQPAVRHPSPLGTAVAGYPMLVLKEGAKATKDFADKGTNPTPSKKDD